MNHREMERDRAAAAAYNRKRGIGSERVQGQAICEDAIDGLAEVSAVLLQSGNRNISNKIDRAVGRLSRHCLRKELGIRYTEGA